MKRVIGNAIIEEYNIFFLMETVRKFMTQVWSPSGGIAAFEVRDDYDSSRKAFRCAQATVKYED